MKAYFADAFFYIALINRHDQRHEEIKEFSRGLRRRIITTQWVWTEVADALSSSLDRPRLLRFYRAFAANPATRIIEVSAQQFKLGFELFDARPDKEWSLTDCISFTIMRQENLREALTGDHHFAQAGFVPLFSR